MTTRRTILSAVGAALVATAAVVLPAAPAGAATATDPVSTIRSASLGSCLDVATTDPAHYFLDTYGRACSGAASQQYAFHAVAGAAAGTYEIRSVATGQCLATYRYGIRQQSCTGAVPPDPGNVEWTLQRVDTHANRYHMELTSTTGAGAASAACIQVSPRPHGYPGTLFQHTACSSSPDQVLTIRLGS